LKETDRAGGVDGRLSRAEMSLEGLVAMSAGDDGERGDEAFFVPPLPVGLLEFFMVGR
jgi:hypothetical protein